MLKSDGTNLNSNDFDKHIIPQKADVSPVAQHDNVGARTSEALGKGEILHFTQNDKRGNQHGNKPTTINAIHLQDSASSKLAYNQNIKALEVLDSILQSNQNKTLDELTSQQREVLSNFRGFGKASNELIDIIKAKDNRYTHCNTLRIFK